MLYLPGLLATSPHSSFDSSKLSINPQTYRKELRPRSRDVNEIELNRTPISIAL
jgi:hypothetical protein